MVLAGPSNSGLLRFGEALLWRALRLANRLDWGRGLRTGPIRLTLPADTGASMAQVFLSYDREDGAKARVVAQALERAGHFVWFDLHIKGGAEYGKVIEQALDAADAVVVMWSAQSVDSAWVRDEAAAGRDKNCLIPVLLEGVNPPMGFRQYQNLDFTGWKGRGKPPRLGDLLESIEALGERSAEAPLPVSRPPTAATPKRAMPRWLVVAGLAVLAIVALGLFVGLVLNGPRKASNVQTIAVEAADAASRPLARDLLVKLSALQGAKSGSMRLLGTGSGAPEADLVFEASSDSDRAELGANLVLLAGKDREILWSKDFEQPTGTLADLKQQMAFTAGRVLGCALEGLSNPEKPLEQQILKLYLNACSQLAEGVGTTGDPRLLVASYAQVTKRAPHFEPAWGGLLIAQTEAASELNTGRSDPGSIQELKRLIAEARKRHPDLPEIRIAERSLLPSNAHSDGMRLMDEAKAASPENPAVLLHRSAQLGRLGRSSESIEDAERALGLDPLSPAMFNNYLSALAYAGRIETAREQLAKAELLWPGSGALKDMQYRFHLRFGDPKEALRLGRSYGYGPGITLFLNARANPSPANVRAFKEYAIQRMGNNIGVLSFTSQAFGELNLNEELYEIVLAWKNGPELADISEVWFRPPLAGFRRDPRFMRVMKKSGHLDYWRKSGKWPDFCFEPGFPYDCKSEAEKLR
jgi:tetratricopeptide (TPR) repeat protein